MPGQISLSATDGKIETIALLTSISNGRLQISMRIVAFKLIRHPFPC